MLNQASVVVRRQEPLTTTVDGEIVMLSPDRGAYFSLGETGSRIWELLETPLSVDELCAGLVDEFAVDADTCHAETLAFLEELVRAGLVEVQDGPA